MAIFKNVSLIKKNFKFHLKKKKLKLHKKNYFFLKINGTFKSIFLFSNNNITISSSLANNAEINGVKLKKN